MPVLGVDVGGTFTDIVSWDGTVIEIAKVQTTADPSDAVASSVPGPVDHLIHGTTAATNAVLEHRGASTVLVTTPGFEDVLEIGRQDRPSLYDDSADRATPLVDRDRRFDGSDIDAITATSPEAIAVALIGAHLDGTEEAEMAARLGRAVPGAAMSLSHLVSPEVREFERTSTTVLNAYLQPVVAGYLARLGQRLSKVAHLTVMRSSGGLMSTARAAELPTAILLSGPAGGTTAAAALAGAMGRDSVISFDMGGTSTDVSRISGGRPDVGYERSIAGYACRMPAVAIHTVGAGGGSIARRDRGGAVAVGPSSAGARPGPACYGSGGTAPTVTDADLVLGRLPARLGTHLVLDPDAAQAALDSLGLGTAAAAARGVVAVVEENMANAIRRVSIDQGADPADASLVAFGGAGGLHATALARALGMASVIVPQFPGVFSALGLLLAPTRSDATVAVPPRAAPEDVAAAVVTAAGEARRELVTMTGTEPTRVATFVDVRYLGQSHEVTVPWGPTDRWNTLSERFHRLHQARNGFARLEDPIEAVTARAEATGPAALDISEVEVAPDGGPAARGHIDIIEGDSSVTAPMWWRPSLSGEVAGPALIIEESCTTYVATTERAVVAPNGALELEW
jgi:N-methylhydantoinase A